jgi:NAD-dependent dihydropyrimidine dehydrogenase PreA subunit
MNIFTTQNAHERGLGTGEIGKIEIAGEDTRGVEVRDFKHSAVAIGFIKRKIPSSLHGFIQGQLTLTPKIILNKCALCMECVDICPKGAAKLDGNLVWIDRSLCIHCMCCHEVCHFQAIKLRQRPLGRIFREANEFFRKAKSLFI